MHHSPETCPVCRKAAQEKLSLPPGPWHDEPDRVDLEHAGFPCFLKRNGMGAWCGYVGVPPTHPRYGKDYYTPDVSVHGGLSYANSCDGCLCHVPKPGDSDDVWWFGFDCGHSGDLIPQMAASPYMGGVYRDLAYVLAETKSLAEQLVPGYQPPE